MTEPDKLKEALAKLGEPPSGTGPDGRSLATDGASDMVQALLQEIDETILARRLVFFQDSGAKMELAVANRRVMRLLSVSDESVLGNRDNLLDQPLSEEASPDYAPLLAVFTNFLRNSKGLKVRSEKQKSSIDASEVGLTAQGLLAALQETPAKVTDPDWQSFHDYCAGVSADWVQYDGDQVSASGGEQGAIDNLANLKPILLAHLKDGNAGQISPDGEPVCIILASEQQKDMSLVLVGNALTQSIFKVSDGQAAAIVKQFHKIV